ncbi:MAG: hypothetical protein L0Y58_11905 [Verrucomicrobia subdivision 3 bacterium]|nr:hypothetical protein [Limisphaerales bacterium]
MVWFDDDAGVTVAGLHIAALEKGIVSTSTNGEQGAAPNGGAAMPSDSPHDPEGPPSVN